MYMTNKQYGVVPIIRTSFMHMEYWPYQRVTSLEGGTLVVYFNLSAPDIWPDKRLPIAGRCFFVFGGLLCHKWNIENQNRIALLPKTNKQHKTYKQTKQIKTKMLPASLHYYKKKCLCFFSDYPGRHPILALFFGYDGCSCRPWLRNEKRRNLFSYNNLYDICNRNIYHIRHLTSTGVLLLVARSFILFGNS